MAQPGVYVESPLDRIVDVHFGPSEPAMINVNWIADMIVLSGEPPPLLMPFTATVMNVTVTNLPPLSRTTLTVDPILFPDIDESTFIDEVYGSFPDGSAGTIGGHYFMRQAGLSDFQGIAEYSTNAPSHPFNGASTIAISETVNLRPLYRGTGYAWEATAHLGELSAHISGTAASEGSISFTASATLVPPAISFGTRALSASQSRRLMRASA